MSAQNLDSDKCIKLVLTVMFVVFVCFVIYYVLSGAAQKTGAANKNVMFPSLNAASKNAMFPSLQCVYAAKMAAASKNPMFPALNAANKNVMFPGLSSSLPQSDYYMVPRYPPPGHTNYNIGTSSVASFVNGNVLDAKVL